MRNRLLALALFCVLPMACAAPARGKAEPDMIFVPGGEAIVGGTGEGARPPRRIVVRPFAIDRVEVSNARFREFDPTHEFPLGAEDVPVVGVSWTAATAYAVWAGKRLPT
ncbi:MAG: SUMF1/EgtB/PvdO family nonheme iron enzyme, partial [Planctomycetes bacterium]|nr:SUMF1/EgtB/PvdO family nonheme iron enzyme [Planctomycetota bacterium]